MRNRTRAYAKTHKKKKKGISSEVRQRHSDAHIYIYPSGSSWELPRITRIKNDEKKQSKACLTWVDTGYLQGSRNGQPLSPPLSPLSLACTTHFTVSSLSHCALCVYEYVRMHSKQSCCRRCENTAQQQRLCALGLEKREKKAACPSTERQMLLVLRSSSVLFFDDAVFILQNLYI